MIERAVVNVKCDSEKLPKFKNISLYNDDDDDDDDDDNDNNNNKITPRRLVKQ
jgi:hypothetical protein